MNEQERELIRGLFDRLARLERSGPPRDGSAENYIHDQLARQPGAPYYMAQTIIVQEKALEAAQARIEALERGNASPRADDRFSGPWGQSGRPSMRPDPSTFDPPRGRDPQGFGRPGFGGGGFGGGGFLAGAAQTAMGVAGGVLLGNMIAGLFDGNDGSGFETAGTDASADSAADSAEPDAGAADVQDASFSDPGVDEGGFDFGDEI
ncbi:DUF2076 domain-containing protein [Chthonobacter albigriseus]|uniref:DUF2076 domain-containing protein n=1 Tax=Chthonobacter albigriseus TaxID=1683161 RepID=UPI0015EF9F48|nr:DUF2076 domain-containing protein [Chthonobacter albigriseus]